MPSIKKRRYNKLMVKKFKYKDVVWIDLESPTPEELAVIGDEYKLHPVATAELENPNNRSKVDVYSDMIYLGLHFPRGLLGRGASDNKRQSLEIDFVVAKNVIITNHYEMINVLNDFGKIFETDFVLKKNSDKLHAGYLFFYILREIYYSMEIGLSSLNGKLRGAGEQIFTGHEREMVMTLANLNYEIMDAHWFLGPHREILLSLELAGHDFFGVKFDYYLESIRSEYEKIWATVESNHNAFLDLRETNDSLLAIKNNDIMRVLMVVAFIVLPLSIISQSAAVHGSAAFWPAIGLMVTSLAITYFIAKHKKWL